MEVLTELVPKKRLIETLEKLDTLVDGFDIPESPMGIPKPNAIAIGILIKNRFSEKSVYPHIRLADVNLVALSSLAMAAELGNLDGIIMTRGDKPRYSDIISYITTEEALEFLRNEMKVSIKLGAIISLRYSLDKIRERISKPFDLFTILRLSRNSIDKLMNISKYAKSLGKKIFAYIIIGTSRNIEFIEYTLKQPYVLLPNTVEFVKEIQDFVDGIIVSCPLDSETQIEILKVLQKEL